MDLFSLGMRIKRQRKLKGWTQDQLAERANVSISFLGHIERGTRKAGMETLVKLANALGVSTDVLLQESLNQQVLHGNVYRQRFILLRIAELLHSNMDTWLD